jgi:hypothetical protein
VVCFVTTYMLVRVVGDKLCGWRITTICDSTVGPGRRGGATMFVCFLWGRSAEERPRDPSMNLKLKQNSSQLVILHSINGYLKKEVDCGHDI